MFVTESSNWKQYGQVSLGGWTGEVGGCKLWVTTWINGPSELPHNHTLCNVTFQSIPSRDRIFPPTLQIWVRPVTCFSQQSTREMTVCRFQVPTRAFSLSWTLALLLCDQVWAGLMHDINVPKPSSIIPPRADK